MLQLKLGDFYVEYQLNAALERTEERLPVLAKLHPNIQDVFNENGVELLSPHYIGVPPEQLPAEIADRNETSARKAEGQDTL